jgi:hypothetical protein
MSMHRNDFSRLRQRNEGRIAALSATLAAPFRRLLDG